MIPTDSDDEYGLCRCNHYHCCYYQQHQYCITHTYTLPKKNKKQKNTPWLSSFFDITLHHSIFFFFFYRITSQVSVSECVEKDVCPR